MKFNATHLQHFTADAGSYSIVTDREFEDSQITLTDFEVELFEGFFGADLINKGNVKSNKKLSEKTFNIYPSGDRVRLNLVFPKAEKTELRLYLAKRRGFKPDPGHVWFAFIKSDDIWLGSMPESDWRALGSSFRIDEQDESYQLGIVAESQARIKRLKERDIYHRDRKVASNRFEQANYACEYDEKHELFISRYSGLPYVEAHHLIPMSVQPIISKALDTIENVFCMCPCCHRAVHHAENQLAREILETLASKRPVLDQYGLGITELKQFYSVEEID